MRHRCMENSVDGKPCMENPAEMEGDRQSLPVQCLWKQSKLPTTAKNRRRSVAVVQYLEAVNICLSLSHSAATVKILIVH